jgi:hypothetical protein
VYPLVPLAPGTAVAVGTLTWNGRLCVGIEVDPALVPAAVLRAALETEFERAFGQSAGGPARGASSGPRGEGPTPVPG